MKNLYTIAAAAALVLLQPVISFSQSFNGKPVYQIETKKSGVPFGTIEVELFPLIAPLHVANFDNLVSVDFYDSTAFHRVIPGFMIQGGDPNSRSGPRNTWGYGQPGQPTVNAEFSKVSHVRGILSAARSSNINSATSQFFICVAQALHLDEQYSAYGRVVSGMNVVDAIISLPRDANDNPLEKVEMFITRTGTNAAVPAAPALVSPADGFAGAQPSQAVTWTAVSDAALYNIELSTDPAFATVLFSDDIKQTATTYTFTSLQPQTQYYWRMQTNNGGFLSPWSASRSFSTGLAAPALLLPPNAFSGATNSPVLEWAAAPGADAYRVQVARTASFIPTSMVHDTTGVQTLELQLNNLLLNTTYYWRVQPLSGSNAGFFSAPWSFRSTVLGMEESAATANQLEVHPNPASGIANIRYQMATPAPTTLRLLDLTGREVQVIATHNAAAGDMTATINTQLLAPGMYLLQLQHGNSTTNRQLAVVR